MKTTKQLQKEYWKCFLPLPRLRVKSIVVPINRPPFKEWLIRISKN